MAKSYYSILGVSPDATTSEVKNAYRRLAKQYHPDHEGGDSRKFRDIQEAYSVLSDSEKRRQYEHRTSGQPVRVRVNRPGYTGGAEPLIPGQQPFAQTRRTGGRFASSAPDDDDLLDLILRHFFGF